MRLIRIRFRVSDVKCFVGSLVSFGGWLALAVSLGTFGTLVMLKELQVIEVTVKYAERVCRVAELLYYCIYKNKDTMPAKGKKGFIFALDPSDHARFKGNCYLDQQDMSVLVSRFIGVYNRKSEQVRAKNKL